MCKHCPFNENNNQTNTLQYKKAEFWALEHYMCQVQYAAFLLDTNISVAHAIIFLLLIPSI
jgi:hypothetical protein